MSAKKESFGTHSEDWDEAEKNHRETTKSAREKEDVRIQQEYRIHADQLRAQLIQLYDRKSQLQDELQAIEGDIEHHEKQQERLINEFDDNEARLASRRRAEDQAQESFFARNREDAASKENVRPKSSNGTRRQPSRDMQPLANGAATWTSINGSRRRGRREEEDEPPADPGNLLSSVYHNPMEESDSLNGRSMPLRSSNNRGRPSLTSNGVATEANADTPESYLINRAKDRPLKPKQRHSLPSIPATARSPSGRPPIPELSSEVQTKPSSGRRSLPSAKGSVPPTERSTPAPIEGQEITRERLVLRDDGKVMIEPPMYAGIPLERIDKDHPYWDPEWEPLEAIMQPQLDKWKEKLDQLRRDTQSIRHTVFLANRQVNRGQSVVNFLKDGEWHPYQFVGKEMMNKFYKTFINYDTMFRLVNVHEELKKFDLDMTPLEWLRQRMYDIAEAQGDKFNLSKTTHDLYHDASLKLLREKHGFGNIGRPSGYKLREKDPEKAAAKKVKQESTGSVRRKARRSIGQVDPDDTPSIEDMQKGSEQPQEVLEPVTPRLQKRQRLEPAPLPLPLPPPPPPQPEPEEDDLEYSGWTSTDSFSAGRIMHMDWRVYQIKTHDLTTSTEVTQYWTWKPEKGLFEHQVLRDVHPKVTWGFYQKPINFDLAVEEIKEIQYAPDSQKVVVSVSDEKRGCVLAYFKRERTKKRFLAFAKRKGIKLVKGTGAQLENSWDTMESKTMPNEDSDT
ncbi:hypothetical protein F4815DRAFT_447023 [Daldinia loculata]|nr:hypothetical protein F4815DRAFT_447023 [Daldinia loculata]